MPTMARSVIVGQNYPMLLLHLKRSHSKFRLFMREVVGRRVGVVHLLGYVFSYSIAMQPLMPIQSICEGKKDIDAQIDAPGLIKIALDTVYPKIQSFCPAFQWRYEEFVVRDSRWVDLSGHHAREPYFYSQCVQAGRKGLKSPIFKTKQFALMVVVPESQWREYEEWTERVEEWTERAEEVMLLLFLVHLG